MASGRGTGSGSGPLGVIVLTSAERCPQPPMEPPSEPHAVKHITFLGRSVPILMQNQNGPCPLLAICACAPRAGRGLQLGCVLTLALAPSGGPPAAAAWRRQHLAPSKPHFRPRRRNRDDRGRPGDSCCRPPPRQQPRCPCPPPPPPAPARLIAARVVRCPLCVAARSRTTARISSATYLT